MISQTVARQQTLMIKGDSIAPTLFLHTALAQAESYITYGFCHFVSRFVPSVVCPPRKQLLSPHHSSRVCLMVPSVMSSAMLHKILLYCTLLNAWTMSLKWWHHYPPQLVQLPSIAGCLTQCIADSSSASGRQRHAACLPDR